MRDTCTYLTGSISCTLCARFDSCDLLLLIGVHSGNNKFFFFGGGVMGYFVFGVLTVGGVCGGVFLKINDSFYHFTAEQIILTG